MRGLIDKTEAGYDAEKTLRAGSTTRLVALSNEAREKTNGG